MSLQYDALHDALVRIQETLESDTTRQAIEDIFAEQRRLWADHAALRDELHESVTALANRIEANAR